MVNNSEKDQLKGDAKVEDTARDNRKKAHKKIFIFLSILFIIGGAYFIYWLLYLRFNISTEDAYVNGNQNMITSQISGNISEIFVEDTAMVKKGDLLFKIDDTDYRLALSHAEAQLGVAVKKYSSLQENVILAKNTVSVRENDLWNATKTFERDSRSYKAGLISEESFQNSKTAFENAKLALEQSRQTLKSIEIQAASDSIYTHPIVSEAITQLKKSYLNLERTKVYSPISGTVAKKSAYLGQQIASGTPLISVINLEEIWVDANYKETEMGQFTPGNSVELVSDYNGKTYRGYIAGISSGSGSALSLLPAQNASGNWIKIVQRVPVRIAIDSESLKDNGPIPIGTSITSTVKLKSTKKEKSDFTPSSTDLYTIDENIIDELVDNIIKNNI